MLRKLLLFIVLVVTGCLNAQTFYWVGGSGYWNDLNHWSYVSGGSPANVVPSSNAHVVFDNSSSSSDFTIHALHSINFKSITSKNTNFKIDVIGSPNVDLTITGDVNLNEYFYFKLNGKINLNPQSVVKYQFSQNRFNNDIYLNANSDVELGVLSTNKSLFISGNFQLKNSILFVKDLSLLNSQLVLVHNTIQVLNNLSLANTQITNPTVLPSNIICKKGNLPQSSLQILNSVPNLKVSPISPQSCVVTLTGSTNPTCSGLCNGTATFDLSGCTNSPYQIQWLNTDMSAPCQVLPPAVDFGDNYTSPTYSVNALCGCGTQYTVLFENMLGEQFAVAVSIINPIPTFLTFSQTQPNCNGVCSGQIRATVISGVVPLSITWASSTATVTHNNVFTRDTLKNACAGTYTVTATNNNGCVNTFTTTLNQPPVLVANGTSSSVTCNASCNGSASVAPTGGTPPYTTYSWVSASSTPSTSSTSTIGNLCPGVVTMTVTDSKTCTATFSANITQPPAITLTATHTDLDCGNICNGTASVTASGGIGPFTYSWSPSGGSAPTATALCAGNYTCTVTNNGNCVKTITVAIIAPPTLTAAPTQTNVLCNNVCSGAINLHPSGGTGAYSYVWSPPAVPSGSLISSLCDGVYSYTITDALGCNFTNSVTITEPPASTLTISSTTITCNGACDGTAVGNMSGGTLAYTYSWSPGNPTGQNTASVSALCPNTYTLKVTDGNGCITNQTVTITQPTAISLVTTSTSPTCNGVCNGSITATPSGGTAPYTYTLQSSGAPSTSGPAPNASFTNLCAGSYTLTVRDTKGCVQTRTINLTQPNPITLTLPFTPINCFNACNSTISTVVGGGTGPYTFTWSPSGSGNSQVNQCAGVHSSTVTDSKGCQASATITITSLPDLTVSITPTNPNCNGQCTGIATTTVTGGTPNYTINFSNGASGNIINNLCQGTYTATVIDFFGCTKTQTVAITTPPALTLTPTNGTVSCTGSCDGTVSVLATGGTAGYFYSWSPTAPVQTGATATGLCAGNYIVSVTDALGCIASTVAAVAQPTVLTASIGNVQPSCNVCIGSATANGIGGTPPYTYAWAPGGQTGASPNNLCVGIQTLTVTDSKNCTTTQTVQINQTVITLITTNGSTLNCNGACTGVATANPVGGVAPYSYTWTPAPVAPTQTTQTASGLCFGTHTVMVSDALGCSSTNTVTFTNPPAITLTVNQTNVNCNGACNGTASASANGGTGVISYLWQPGGQTTSSINGLCAGAYTVTATDINNCSQTQVVTITENSLLTATFTPSNPTTCTSSDGSITAVIGGGLPAYSFTWSPGGSTVSPLTNVGAGTYTLSVKDAAGCTQTIVTTLSNPTGPTVTAVSNSITCFGACTGSATLTIAGTGPFNVNGSAIAGNTTTLSGLCSGITTPIITDANSCVTNQTINIAQPTQLVANGVVTNDPCNASCTASINLTPSGGTLPYSYVWTPAGAGQDPINLCAGVYTVNITDGNSCVTTNTYAITEPPALTLSFNKKDVLCNNQCTGGVRAVVGGGASPYTYTWTPSGTFVGSNIDTLVNVCSGIYTVSASDANGCIITGTIDIGQPTALTSTITSINQKCFGQCNGSATITASGGVAPYSYNYNTTPVTPTQTIGGLCIGTYTGGVSDANGCISSNSFVITQPLPIVVTTTISNPKCNAVCNGSVATTVTGGNPNYSYNWIPAGGPVPNPTGLCAGNYTVIVTDDSLCTGQALVVLTDPAILLANTSFTNPSCNASCNGVVTANPIGGTAPFSYSWANPVVNSQTVSNLCSGVYTLTLSDANTCQAVQTVTLTDPPVITINPSLAPATCSVSNGSINAVASNGVAPYTYNWLNPILAGQATNTMVTNIPAGTYTVVVTDNVGCSTTSVIPLSNADGPTGATITSTNVTCNSQCNGAADVSNPLGGTAPYTLSWINPVSASPSVSGLCAGTYTAEIADANNCLFFQSVVITEPQTIDDNEIITSAACLGNCNGSIALNPGGGNGGYTYSWSPAAATGTISNLCPGVYTATITDVQGCTLVANYILPSLTTITSSTFATNNSCFGNCNGSVLATNVAGGLPPYSFSWSDPAGQSTSTASNLCNGNYSVTITDANGCFNVLPSVITSPSAITFTPTVTQPNCGLCNGAAIVNPIGGTAGYTFVWTNGQTINTASNLCAGVYGVQITDANACVTNSNVIINSSSSITGETITQQDVSCSGVCDGTVTVTAIGGTAPITYHWLHNGSSSQTLNGLCAGTYFCNMTDVNGCTRTASVVIGATTNFTITPQITQSSCSVNDGAISVNVLGGTGAYTYIWTPAAPNAPSLTNLAPGNYTLTVSDGNCSQTQVYSINAVNGPIVTATQNDVSCSGLCDGSISLVISGGTPAYTTAWSNGASTPSINGLCVGAYSYTVTDGAGCKAVQSFSLTTGTPIVFSTPDIDNPLCNNNCNGVVTTIPSGGTLPYSYNWVVSTSTTSIANALCAGNYSVTVTDANGCSAQETYTLTGPPTITLTAVVTDAKCNASATGSINLAVSGGVPGPGYTYSWTPTNAITEDITNLTAGTYSVVITDANGCNVDSSFVVNEPTAIVDNSVITSAACFGNCNGSIALTPTGGTAPYSYSWTPSASTGTITSLCPGPQTATITDGQGCTMVFNYNVPSLTTITASTLAVNNLCYNDCNGVLTATTIAGGVGPYTVQWNDPLGQMGNTASGLCTGSYSATITDANGCFNKIPADISSTSQVTFTPNITQPSCDLCNGSAVVNPVGGTAPYNYLWSNNQMVNTATNLCSGVYAVQITDGNGCVNTTNVVINSSSGITGETIVSTNVTCDASVCDGSANVTAVGGVAPISYNWVHDNSTSQSVSNLCAGTYFCNMTDANGCSRTASVVIVAATTLTISSQVTQSSCSSNTGSITVNVTGGTGVYTYVWLPAGNTPTVSNLSPGSYTLTVSDGNCSKSQIFTIQSINAPVITSTKKDISCSGVCDGNIAITITGGTPAYNTVWSNGATTPSISALCAGTYSVEVTDAAGCKAVRNFSLSTVTPIAFSVPDLDSPQCHDACDGSLTAIPIGGTMPYTFTWTPNNVNTATANSLCTGNYSITVTDANGCSVSDNYSLINPPTLTLTATITDASCNTALDGAVTTTVTGGIPPFVYNWTPGAVATSSLTNVLSGTYTLTVTDNFGCVIDSAITINSTLSVNAVAGNDTLFCQNGTLLLDGSNSNSTFGTNTYEWFVVPSAAPISNSVSTTVSPSVGTSTYVLVATNGVCIDSDTIVVNSNALPIVDAGPTVSIPLLGSGTIGGNPTCATGSSFSWSPVVGLDNPTGTNPVSATTVTTIYTVSVIDVNGCFNSDTVTVYVYPEIKIPNGFSPNGDGKNDVWQIDFIDQFPDCEVEVYNRWGEQLFYSRGYAVPFNGQYKGKNLPVGTYYYVVKLNHPNYPTPYTSPLTIFR